VSANLILCHNWGSLLIDGNADNVAAARAFFSAHRETWWQPPKILQSWVTRGNINQTLRSQGFSGSIDLLILDMDGVEFHIWESLTEVNPRVLVVEINDLWTAEVCVAIRYKDPWGPGSRVAVGEVTGWWAAIATDSTVTLSETTSLLTCFRK
jgi:hypothetical protein